MKKLTTYLSFFVTVFLLISGFNKLSAQKKRTSKQIELSMQEKKSRTDVEKKIDSQLLQAIREKRGKKMAPGVDLEPANVNVDSTGKVEVDINGNVTVSLIDTIKKSGGVIIYSAKEYHTIKAKVSLSMVEKIAALPEVKFIGPTAVPQLNTPIRPY